MTQDAIVEDARLNDEQALARTRQPADARGGDEVLRERWT
jgi:hypothetical protein